MAEDVEVPGAGKVGKKQMTIIIGLAATYVGYRWWKAKTAPTTGANAAVGTGAAATTPGTLVGTDAAGQPVYQTSAGAYVNSAGNPDTIASPTAGSTDYTNPNDLAPYNQPSATGDTTNQQWTQNVVNDLNGLGYDAQTVATALAAYLAQQPLTPDQVNIVRTAWAYEGRPPQNPDLNIVQAGTGTSTTTGTGTTTTGTGPAAGNYPPVSIGQVVQVPVEIENGQNWNTIAAKAGISAAHLQSVNPGASGKVGTVISVPVEVISASQTWASIASAWGISAAHLQSYNPQLA